MMLGVRNVGSVQLCISPASYGIGWPQGLLGGPKWPPHAHADSADDWLGVWAETVWSLHDPLYVDA